MMANGSSLLLVGTLVVTPWWTLALAAERPIYWCPKKFGGTIQDYPEAGCEAIRKEPGESGAEPRRSTPIEPSRAEGAQFEQEFNAWLTNYRRFLSCCQDDPQKVWEAQALDLHAQRLLDLVERTFSNAAMIYGRGGAMIQTLQEARATLAQIRARHGTPGR